MAVTSQVEPITDAVHLCIDVQNIFARGGSSSSQLKRMRPSDRADLVVNQQHASVFGSESILVHV
ncbi:MAG: hypothetical protein QOJ15_4104 [Bradyrhizobium sp.]|jgi:hypothetical protein|nr:hypothetical protein [Bradyrhizobium sp.]